MNYIMKNSKKKGKKRKRYLLKIKITIKKIDN